MNNQLLKNDHINYKLARLNTTWIYNLKGCVLLFIIYLLTTYNLIVISVFIISIFYLRNIH